jgi:hypothetical protein
MSYQPAPEGKDPQLWNLAQRRASFKRHLVVYLILNAFFWVLWYFSGGPSYNEGLPWPVWPMLGWGIGLGFHYAGAYMTTGHSSVQNEYDKLMQERNRQ